MSPDDSTSLCPDEEFWEADVIRCALRRLRRNWPHLYATFRRLIQEQVDFQFSTDSSEICGIDPYRGFYVEQARKMRVPTNTFRGRVAQSLTCFVKAARHCLEYGHA